MPGSAARARELPEPWRYARIFLKIGGVYGIRNGRKVGQKSGDRFPLDIARAAGLSDGERVEIEARDGDIVIRRPDADAAAEAQVAAEEIIEESRRHSLGDATIRELLDDGRRE